MNRLKPGVDIVYDILLAVAEAQPHNTFAQSILFQYQERGGLSKKQLQGLLGKAKKLTSLPQSKLATLEAIILKKPEKNKSALPANVPMFTKDEIAGEMINKILTKYPSHLRVKYLKAKFENNEPLSSSELTELQRFSKLL
ncbi:MAG: hypothetical protein IPM85_14920 [Chitinophagaceae bacterium]|nr:hypothetical protein [Chitinophagaceae bacterium]